MCDALFDLVKLLLGLRGIISIGSLKVLVPSHTFCRRDPDDRPDPDDALVAISPPVSVAISLTWGSVGSEVE